MEDPLLDPDQLSQFLRAHRLPPLERFGQHFLVDHGVLADLVAASETDPTLPIIEIGAGLGVLTRALAEARARKARSAKHKTPLIAVELDRRLIPLLKERVGEFPNATVVQADILHADVRSLLPKPDTQHPALYDVIGNIPYNITAPIFKRFLTALPRPRRLTFLVDDSVAAAIAARPPDMSIRAISVQIYAVPEVVRRRIPPAAFVPPPAVHSAILTLSVRTTPLVSPEQERAFFRLVRAGFSQRRKILANALAATERIRPAEAAFYLRRTRINPTRRAETLSLAEWKRLLAVWEQRE